MKRGLVLGLFVGVLITILLSTISASDVILRLSSETNAHGQTPDSSGYNIEILYSTIFGSDYSEGGEYSCTENSKILGLSAPTNAHAQIPSKTDYATNVCYGNLNCGSKNSCDTNVGEKCVIKLSSETNAHLSTCDSNYPISICCLIEGEQAPICGNQIKEEGEQCDISEEYCNNPGEVNECQCASGYTYENNACTIIIPPSGTETPTCSEITDRDECDDYTIQEEYEWTNPDNQCVYDRQIKCVYNQARSKCEYSDIKTPKSNQGTQCTALICNYNDEVSGDCSTGDTFTIKYTLVPDSHSSCEGGSEKTISCLNQVKLPFFSLWNFLTAILAISIIYGLLAIRKTKN